MLRTYYCYHEQIARKLNYSKEDKNDELVTGEDNKREDTADTGNKDNMMETPTSSKKGKRRIVYSYFVNDDDDDDDNNNDDNNNDGDEDDDSDDDHDDHDNDKASIGMNNDDDDEKNDKADDKESGRMVVTPLSINLNMSNLNVAPDESVNLFYTGDRMMDGFDPRTFQNIQERNSGNYQDELIVKDFVKKSFFPHVS